jgi:acyl carrier protein
MFNIGVHRLMSLKSTIIEHMRQIAKEQERQLEPLTDDLVLVESGLDSLGFAILVARLEDTLGFDPFTTSDDVYYPVTLGDFIRFYDDAAKSLEVASGRAG